MSIMTGGFDVILPLIDKLSAEFKVNNKILPKLTGQKILENNTNSVKYVI